MKKNFFKKLACAVAVSTVCASAGAVVTDLGLVPAGTNKSFNGKIIGGPAPIGFTDFFVFDIPANGGSAYSVVNFPVPEFGVDLAFASIALFSMGSDGAFGGSGSAADSMIDEVDGVPVVGSPSLSFSAAALPPGKMYLFVSGFTTGSAGGLYNGSVSVFPVPVPEPETWAMMLVGAGLVGFRLRSRTKKSAATRLV